MPRASRNDIVELFGYQPDDLTTSAMNQWRNDTCPFVGAPCSKTNHDKSLVYGVCTVSLGDEDLVICPNRLYADNYSTLRAVAMDAYGALPVYQYRAYKQLQALGQAPRHCIVAKPEVEVREPGSRDKVRIDWCLVELENGRPTASVPVEVQSLDITNNYRDCWDGYDRLKRGERLSTIPNSAHGLNWANVHKRLIPQLIRKGNTIRSSQLCSKGMYFVVPELVYQRFETIVRGVELVEQAGPGIITIMTYRLGTEGDHGGMRTLEPVRVVRVRLVDFAMSFISDQGVPAGRFLDDNVRAAFR